MNSQKRGKRRIGIFISKYDAGSSHTRDIIKSFADKNIYVDYFLFHPGGFKGVDTFSFKSKKITVYNIQRNLYIIDQPDNWFKKNINRINHYFVSIFLFLENLHARGQYIFRIKNVNLIIPTWAQRLTSKIITQNIYSAFIGIEPRGLIYAGIMSGKFTVPYLYHSYELNTKAFPNGQGEKFLQEYNVLKDLEKKYHSNAITTIIQDEERKNILYKENSINEVPVSYFPVSLKDEPRREKGTFFHKLFSLDPNIRIILQYGTIFTDRLCKDIAISSKYIPDGYVIVMHGKVNKDYFYELESLTNSGKLFFSTSLVEPNQIKELISSAYIGLSFYATDDPNSLNTGLSSHKLAHYTQCGLPIISNNYPSISKLFDKLKFGICVNNVNEIPDVIQKIDSEYEKFSNNSFKTYLQYYKISNYLDDVIKIFPN